MPDHRPAGLRHPGDRLCAAPLAGRIEVTQALCRKLPQSRRLSRGRHGGGRQTARNAARAALAAHWRLLVSARRHADRCILAIRQVAGRRLGAGPGRCGLSGTVRLDYGRALASLSKSISTRSSPSISLRGIMFGPSDGALSGSGWVSMKIPATPTATAARASTGTNARSPPDEVPRPPGCWTEWVASKMTGAPVAARI